MKIELFHVPGCRQCEGAVTALRTAAHDVVPNLSWREVNVLQELDRAVELGVFTLPALVVDDDLAFAPLPTPQELSEVLIRRSRAVSDES